LITVADFITLNNTIKNNGTVDAYGNPIVQASFTSNDDNPWYYLQNIAWIFNIAFVVIFFCAIALAIHQLYHLLKGKSFELSVAFVCLIFVIIENLIKIPYFITGPFFIYPTLSDFGSLAWMVASWPFPMFNVLLISLFWEELLTESFKKKSFLERYKAIWITICIIILAFELVITLIIVLTSTDLETFSIVTSIDLISQIAIGCAQIIYCLVNTIRLAIVIKKTKSTLNNSGTNFLTRTSVAVIVANIGLLLFVLSLVLQLPTLGFVYPYNIRYIVWVFLSMGQFIADIGIMFSFKTTEDPKSASSNISKSVVSELTFVRN